MNLTRRVRPKTFVRRSREAISSLITAPLQLRSNCTAANFPGKNSRYATPLNFRPKKFATSSEQLLRVMHYRDGSLIVLLMLTQDELIDNVMMLQFLS